MQWRHTSLLLPVVLPTVAALALVAQAAVIGTRFLASVEARAHTDYKKKLVAANDNDTIRTTLFGFG
jgi:NAD(P)H-dependent flavin oxidoreductase YrpB (nitropropane dioxygenase family)